QLGRLLLGRLGSLLKFRFLFGDLVVGVLRRRNRAIDALGDIAALGDDLFLDEVVGDAFDRLPVGLGCRDQVAQIFSGRVLLAQVAAVAQMVLNLPVRLQFIAAAEEDVFGRIAEWVLRLAKSCEASFLM